MTYLADTSVLGRLANVSDAYHVIATDAVLEIHRSGQELHLTAQSLIEFRCFATRPMSVNGLGMTSAAAEAMAAVFESQFTLLPESAAIYPAWKNIVQAYAVVGKQVYDARLAAVCYAHGLCICSLSASVISLDSQALGRGSPSSIRRA
jgi:hypothetical protein